MRRRTRLPPVSTAHGANGYLIDQFLPDDSNLRRDQYGGSVENRARLLLEVVDGIAADIGADRLGVRLSPYSMFNGTADSDPVALFGHALAQLRQRRIAYLHMMEARASEMGLTDDMRDGMANNAAIFRKVFDGPMISAGGYQRDQAVALVASAGADAVAFGRSYIANPDLVERFASGAELNRYDRATFYGGAEAGYLDGHQQLHHARGQLHRAVLVHVGLDPLGAGVVAAIQGHGNLAAADLGTARHPQEIRTIPQ